MPDPIVVTTTGPLGDFDTITVTTSGPIGEISVTRRTILNVIQDVCPFIGLSVPSAVFSSTLREHVELARIANEMAHRIAFDTHDWSKLKTKATITGDGTTEAFLLPEDYKRMLRTTQLWSNNNINMPLCHEPDTDRWLELDALGIPPINGVWTLIGEQIYIKPILAAGVEVSFIYLSNLCVIDPLNNFTDRFTSDDDAFVLDERLLRLGIIWQWKQLKGFDFSEDLETYQTALDKLVVSDKGPATLKAGRPPRAVGRRYAWPGTLG